MGLTKREFKEIQKRLKRFEASRLPISEREKLLAFGRWQLTEGNFKIDDIEKMQSGFSQLKEARLALQKSSLAIAEILKINESSLRELEASEINKTISLGKMKEVAQAMDCDFIYAVVHKSRKTFGQLIWEQLFEIAKLEEKLYCCLAWQRAGILHSLICKKLKDQKTRKSLGWSRSLRN